MRQHSINFTRNCQSKQINPDVYFPDLQNTLKDDISRLNTFQYHIVCTPNRSVSITFIFTKKIKAFTKINEDKIIVSIK